MKITRRKFVLSSILGISGSAIVPAGLKIPRGIADYGMSRPATVMRTLGKTGIRLPFISMGTGDTNNPRLVTAAYDRGIRLFATSSYYGGGNNEVMLGEALSRFSRDSFMIATSSTPIGIDHKEGLFTDKAAGSRYVKDIEESLLRLKTDYADIVFLAFAAKRQSVFFEPLMKAMQDLKRQGKARWIGIATHSFCDEAIVAAADSGVYDLVMTAYNFKNNGNRKLTDAIDYAAKAGLGIIGMKSAAGAFWDKDRKLPVNTHAALKWVLHNEKIATIVSGMTSFEELENNLRLHDNFKLTDQERMDLKLSSKEPVPGLYCTQCHECTRQCRYAIDIPTVMRSYMYAYGYGNHQHSLATLRMSGLNGFPCRNCPQCTVTCESHFNVREKIRDVAGLIGVEKGSCIL
jgi:predicted aldo/keto reductase-like oxidoreductase